MKIIKEIVFLIGVLKFSEILSIILNKIIVIPGPILGMLLLFLFLKYKVIDLSMIEISSKFFLEHITLFVLPLGLSLVKYGSLVKDYLLPMVICGVGVTIISLAFMMKFIDTMVNFIERGDEKNG